MASEDAVLRIGEVARRTDVAVPTLRAWERRYGLLDPQRTEGGHRLYRESDVERVQRMRRLLDEGWQAAAAAREALRPPPAPTRLSAVAGAGDPASVLVDRLRTAIEGFDAAAADEVVDDVLARLEIPRALDEVLLPVLRGVGEGWQEDPRVIAREHFATNTLRPRLHRLLRASPRSGERTCVAAAPEHEEHDLGLLAGAVVAASAGWRVHYLGARTPSRALERTVAELGADAVLVGAIFRTHAEEFLDDPPALAGTPVVLGGEGFRSEDASRLPNALVHTGPISSVAGLLERAARGAFEAG
jgi:MerR family transcriptional regulator, light-induced transcriptional regulator